MFYNPDKPGNRKDPTFHRTPKLYVKRGSAVKAQAFCASGVNNHWLGAGYPYQFKPIITEIVEISVTVGSKA